MHFPHECMGCMYFPYEFTFDVSLFDVLILEKCTLDVPVKFSITQMAHYGTIMKCMYLFSTFPTFFRY